MKFTVRVGFAVHHTRRVERAVNGQKQIEEQTQSFWPENEAFELEESVAKAHAHKLEPADSSARKFMESLVPVPPAPVGIGGLQLDPQVLASIVAQVTAAQQASAAATAAPQA